MARRERSCYLCGTEYKYCPTCTSDKMKPAWMYEFHSESCKDIFDICTRFNMGMMSKTEAQDALASCDLTNKENFKSYVQHDLEVIFSEEPVSAEIAEEEATTCNTTDTQSHEVVNKKENKAL